MHAPSMSLAASRSGSAAHRRSESDVRAGQASRTLTLGHGQDTPGED